MAHSADVSRAGTIRTLERAADDCTNPGEKLRLSLAAGVIPYVYGMLQERSEPGIFFLSYPTTKHARKSPAGKTFEVIKFSKSWIIFPDLGYREYRVLVVRIEDDSVNDLELQFPIRDQSVIARSAEIRRMEMKQHPSAWFLDGVNRSAAGGCASCMRRCELRKCTSCRRTQYCSKACQKSDWPHHKADCRRVAKVLERVTHMNKNK
jgi:hypothetical protein